MTEPRSGSDRVVDDKTSRRDVNSGRKPELCQHPTLRAAGNRSSKCTNERETLYSRVFVSWIVLMNETRLRSSKLNYDTTTSRHSFLS